MAFHDNKAKMSHLFTSLLCSWAQPYWRYQDEKITHDSPAHSSLDVHNTIGEIKEFFRNFLQSLLHATSSRVSIWIMLQFSRRVAYKIRACLDKTAATLSVLQTKQTPCLVKMAIAMVHWQWRCGQKLTNCVRQNAISIELHIVLSAL